MIMGTHYQFFGTPKQLPMGFHELKVRNPKKISHKISLSLFGEYYINMKFSIFEISMDTLCEVGTVGKISDCTVRSQDS